MEQTSTNKKWLQRFKNFQKVVARLEDAVAPIDFEEIEEISEVYSELEIEGLIQRFEYTYELAWKTLQDLLKDKGYVGITGPKSVIAQSLKDGYITNQGTWEELQKARNIVSHTYDAPTATEIAEDIVHSYFPILKALEIRLIYERDGITQQNLF